MGMILGYVEENLIFIATVLIGLLLIVLWHYFERQPTARKTDSIKKDLKVCSNAIADIRHQTIKNSAKLQELEDEAKSIQASVKRIEQGMASVRGVVDEILSQLETFKSQTLLSQAPTESQSEPIEPISPILKKLCNDYNIGIANRSQREELRKNYEKHYRVGVINASERRLNPEQPPALNSDTSGNYLAFYIEAEDLYAVVPLYGLTLQESIYGPGAFGEVFECPDFNPQLRYRDIKVLHPAILEPDSALEQWTLKEKGKLDLGSGF